jgi:uncharacterized protein YndB with AHSA1/START domain
MSDQSFTTTLTVAATPEETFAAINDVRGWWSQDVDGPTATAGAEFVFRGNAEGRNVHRSRIRVTELVPGERVAWHVVDNWLSFIDDQREWKDTQIVFEISATGHGTEVRFRHVGLVSAYECFEVCSNAWTFFIQESLRDLITTGQGSPIERLETPHRAASA